MPIIFMDGFDHYTDPSEKWDWMWGVDAGGYFPEIGGAYARYGTGGVRFVTQGSGWGSRDANLAKLTPEIGATGVIGFACYFGSATTSEEYYRYPLQVYESFNSTRHFALGWSNFTPTILSVYGPGGLVGTGTIPISLNRWYYVEIGFTIGDAGSFELRINGITSVMGTGDIKGGGTGTCGWVRFRNQISTFYLDDVYMSTGAGFNGDTRVQYLAPSGAGVKTDFTPLSGSNWANVDETSINNADYNSSSVAGAMDLFAMPDLGNVQVFGVQPNLRFKKDDAGFRSAKPVLYRANADDGGTPPSTTTRWYLGARKLAFDSFVGASWPVLASSPFSGAAWTRDEVNALQYGYAVGDAGMFTLDAKVV